MLYVLPCVILFLCFSVLLVLRIPRLGKRELILVLFLRLFDLCLFGFVGFLFLLVFGKGCDFADFCLRIYFGNSLEPPRRGGSNEYPQCMFLSRNKKNYAYPCKPQFYYIKVGFKGVKII